MSSSVGSYVEPVTNVGLPRNERFTGRVAVLALLHSELSPSFQGDDISLRTRCSCLIHAIGGMGKTETALEYTYRYRHCYTHVFWLRAQTPTTLLESFLEVVTKLGLDEKGADPDKKVQVGLNWFQTTSKCPQPRRREILTWITYIVQKRVRGSWSSIMPRMRL